MSAWITTYHDLCKEIEVLELRAEEIELQVKRIHSKMSPGPSTRMVASYEGMPGAGMAVYSFTNLYDDLHTITSELDEVYDILALKCEYKLRMEAKMSEFEGIENKVAYERDIQRKPLFQIAKEMDYSYDWIRKISQRVKRQRPA